MQKEILQKQEMMLKEKNEANLKQMQAEMEKAK